MLRFDNRVAIVTGAGRGLGRAHALELAGRGASVIVNDIGCDLDGTGTDAGPATAVVREIRDGGGVAVASTDDVATVAGARAIIDTALAAFGRVDIVVNNAGTTGGMPVFGGITEDQVNAVLGPHLLGTLHVSQAAWGSMAEQGYGRIVNTTSGVGFFGMQHATTYAAAKMGIAGLSAAMAIEGREHGIGVNAVAPFAKTRMAPGVFDSLGAAVDPAQVSAVVAFLAHESCALSGQVLSAGAGRVAEIVISVTRGYIAARLTAEAVAEQLTAVTDRRDAVEPADALAEIALAASMLAELPVPEPGA